MVTVGVTVSALAVGRSRGIGVSGGRFAGHDGLEWTYRRGSELAFLGPRECRLRPRCVVRGACGWFEAWVSRLKVVSGPCVGAREPEGSRD